MQDAVNQLYNKILQHGILHSVREYSQGGHCSLIIHDGVNDVLKMCIALTTVVNVIKNIMTYAKYASMDTWKCTRWPVKPKMPCRKLQT
jgi:hypothetical protein